MENMVRPASESEVKEFGKDHGLIHEAVVTGRKVGAGEDFWGKLAHDEELFRRAVAFVNSDGELKSSPVIEAPAVIIKPTDLGRDYFMAEDWQQLRGLTLTDQQRDLMPKAPWDDELLASPCPFDKKGKKRIGETHYGFLGLASAVYTRASEPMPMPIPLLNLLILQRIYPATGQPKFASYAPESWYANQDFANLAALEFRYYLLLRGIVPRSTALMFSDQTSMLPAEYEVPPAIAETTKDLIIYDKLKVYVNPRHYARTSDLDSDGNRVSVGVCDAIGVYLNYWHGDDPYDRIGVGAARKFEKKLVA
jgi:hypothetical protein